MYGKREKGEKSSRFDVLFGWYKRKMKEIEKKDELIIFKSTKTLLIQKKMSYPI